MRALLLVLPLLACHSGEAPGDMAAPTTDTGPRHTPPISGPEHCSFWLGVAAHYGVALTMDLAAIWRVGIKLI